MTDIAAECVGFSLSTQDGQGYLKTQILEASMIYSPVFTAGMYVLAHSVI